MLGLKSNENTRNRNVKEIKQLKNSTHSRAGGSGVPMSLPYSN
jgi:hypothetical protein